MGKFVSEIPGFDPEIIKFQLFVPDLVPEERVPLIIFFHGMGSVGEDNQLQLRLIGKFAADEFQLPYGKFFILAPQCTPENLWVDAEWGSSENKFKNEPTAAMQQVITLLDRVLHDFAVDLTRVYVGGASMGGFATWDICRRMPEWFAAAFPICPGGDPKQLEVDEGLQVWTFHGGLDRVVPPESGLLMAQAAEKRGCRVRLSFYPELEHNSWDAALSEPYFLPWLFSCSLRRL